MATLNFPDTAGQPTDGSFLYTVNGVSYSWDGEKWNANTVASLGDAFVNVTGDNMTGDLTLGTDKITLDATGGGAEFAGKIDIGDYTNTQGVTIRDGGSVRVKRPTSSTAGAFIVQNETGTVAQWLNNGVFVSGGNAILNDANIQLNAGDGSATFAGNVDVGNYGSGDEGVRLSNQGAINIQRAGTGQQGAFAIRDNNGDQNTTLYSDGGASFAGTHSVGDYDFSQTDKGGIEQQPYGRIIVQRSLDQADASILQGWAGTSKNLELNADGSATFAGTVRFDDANNASYRTSINKDGVRTLALNSNAVIYQSTESGSPKITFYGDGRATFAGNITAGNVSDIKFKENITDANPQLADVTALGNSLKNWDWKEEAPLNDELKAKRFLGLIAQEAEQICPGVTYEVSDGEDSYKAINHDILVMKLLGAVAELKAEIEQLKGG